MTSKDRTLWDEGSAVAKAADLIIDLAQPAEQDKPVKIEVLKERRPKNDGMIYEEWGF